MRERLRQYRPDADGCYKEATIVYGALKILGLEHAIPEVSALPELGPESKMHDLPEFLNALFPLGMVGYHFTHELQHIAPRGPVDVALGVSLLEEVAEKLLPAVDHLAEYLRYLNAHPKLEYNSWVKQ